MLNSGISPFFINVLELDKEPNRRADRLNLVAEREAIILAEDLQGMLILDDRKARNVAKTRGIETVRTWESLEKHTFPCLFTRDRLEEI